MSGLTVAELRRTLAARGLPTKGTKDELEKRYSASKSSADGKKGVTVAELRAELSSRGLDAVGTKEVLMQRLTEALAGETKGAEKTDKADDALPESEKAQDTTKPEQPAGATDKSDADGAEPPAKRSKQDDSQKAAEAGEAVNDTDTHATGENHKAEKTKEKADPIEAMTVAQLRKALTKRGLDATGVKTVLAERLKEAQASNASGPSGTKQKKGAKKDSSAKDEAAAPRAGNKQDKPLPSPTS